MWTYLVFENNETGEHKIVPMRVNTAVPAPLGWTFVNVYGSYDEAKANYPSAEMEE